MYSNHILLLNLLICSLEICFFWFVRAFCMKSLTKIIKIKCLVVYSIKRVAFFEKDLIVWNQGSTRNSETYSLSVTNSWPIIMKSTCSLFAQGPGSVSVQPEVSKVETKSVGENEDHKAWWETEKFGWNTRVRPIENCLHSGKRGSSSVHLTGTEQWQCLGTF